MAPPQVGSINVILLLLLLSSLFVLVLVLLLSLLFILLLVLALITLYCYDRSIIDYVILFHVYILLVCVYYITCQVPSSSAPAPEMRRRLCRMMCDWAADTAGERGAAPKVEVL